MSRTCWNCGGTGKVTYHSETSKYREVWDEDCGKCDGTGEIKEREDEE